MVILAVFGYSQYSNSPFGSVIELVGYNRIIPRLGHGYFDYCSATGRKQQGLKPIEHILRVSIQIYPVHCRTHDMKRTDFIRTGIIYIKSNFVSYLRQEWLFFQCKIISIKYLISGFLTIHIVVGVMLISLDYGTVGALNVIGNTLINVVRIM